MHAGDPQITCDYSVMRALRYFYFYYPRKELIVFDIGAGQLNRKYSGYK
jgi:hypothetical protein